MRASKRPRLLLTAISFIVLLAVPAQLLMARPQASTAAPVRIFFSARDAHGNPVEDLKADEIQLAENGKPLRVAALRKANADRLIVGLMIDASGSRVFQLPGAERLGAAQFLEDITKLRADMFLGTFSKQIFVHAELSSDPAQLKAGLQTALATPPRGTSALYTAIAQASNTRLARQDARKILVITCDGVDNSSLPGDNNPDVLAERLLRDGTILYGIVMQDLEDRTSRSARRDGVKNMKRIAEQTGGQTFAVDSTRQVTEAFERIALAVGSQYRLDFLSNDPPSPGRFREIRVKTTRKGVVVSSPAGYYLPTK